MSKRRQAFIDWVYERCGEGERLLAEDLAESPRYYFSKGSSEYAVEFFTRVERWRGWVSGFVTGLHRRAEHVDHLVAELQRNFDEAQLLVFSIADINYPDATRTFDLRGSPATFTSGVGWMELRRWFERGVEDPLWPGVRDTLMRAIRSVRSRLTGQAHELRLLSLDAAVEPTVDAPSEPSPPAVARYVCIKPLGEGAYGEAWRTRDAELNREVAVKFIRSTGASRKEAVEHGRALARVTDPSIVAVYDVARVLDPKTSTILDGVVMELVEGPSLVERLGLALDRAEALRVGSAILDAVAAYHAKGLAHLDLHDGNVIVGERFVKVIDPMYSETTVLKATPTRDAAQQRELRRARDILADLVRATGAPPSVVVQFEHDVAKPSIDLLRASFREALEHRDAAPVHQNAAPEHRDAAPVPEPRTAELVTGFQPGVLADIARGILGRLASMGSEGRKGHSAMITVAPYATEIDQPTELVLDAATLLAQAKLVMLERMSKVIRMTRLGREEAHRLGEPIPSPRADADTLLAFLVNHGDGPLRGYTKTDHAVVGPALGFNLLRLRDAGEVLESMQAVDMTSIADARGSGARFELTARGRELGRRFRIPEGTKLPQPDVRVVVSPGFVHGANGLTDLLIVAVQNHSPNPFYLSTITLATDDGQHGVFAADDATGIPNSATTVMSGDSHSLRISAERIRKANTRFVAAVVTDKIGRRFESDRTAFAKALKALKLS